MSHELTACSCVIAIIQVRQGVLCHAIALPASTVMREYYIPISPCVHSLEPLHSNLGLSHALLSCRGGMVALVTAGTVVIVCAAALLVTKTRLVPLVKERWNMQPYESVDPERSVNSIDTIPLRDIKVDNEATSEAPTSARSRSPGRTQGFS